MTATLGWRPTIPAGQSAFRVPAQIDVRRNHRVEGGVSEAAPARRIEDDSTPVPPAAIHPQEHRVTARHTEADARIAIDDRLRQAGWDPLDRSMVGAEVHVVDSSAADAVVDRSRTRPFETHAPVYDLEAAAGAFGPDRVVGMTGDEIGWAPEPVRLTPDHFVTCVIGRSMKPAIPDGSHCLFRVDRGGSRQGKLVLVWQRGVADPALGGEFSVKKYESAKGASADGDWSHREIRLKPLNPDPRSVISFFFARGRGRPSGNRRTRRRSRPSDAIYDERSSRLRSLRRPRPSPRCDRDQEERHPPLRCQAAGAPLCEGARCTVHLPDQRRAHVLLGTTGTTTPALSPASSRAATWSAWSRYAPAAIRWRPSKSRSTTSARARRAPCARTRSRPCTPSTMHALELGKRRFLIELPTGTDKTDLVCLYLKRLFQAGWVERVLVLVDRDQLVRQALEAIQYPLSAYPSYWLRPGAARQEQQNHGGPAPDDDSTMPTASAISGPKLTPKPTVSFRRSSSRCSEIPRRTRWDGR